MASAAPRQQQPARPEGRLTKGTAEPAPPGEGYGLDTVLPWRQALLPPPTGQPPEQVAPPIMPVAWLGRTSTEDSQDPTISLPRQLRNSRDALPDGYIIVAHFYDVESGRKNLDERGSSRAPSNSTSPSRATAASRTCSPRPPGPTAVSWRSSPSRSSGSPAAPISAPRSSTSLNKAESRCSPPTSPSPPAPRARAAGGHANAPPRYSPGGSSRRSPSGT